MVSFNAALHREVQKAQEEEQNVVLTKCTVQWNKFRPDEVEIIANSQMKLTQSLKKFRVDNTCSVVHQGDSKLELLHHLQDVAIGQSISFHGKVLRVEEPESVYSKVKEKSLRKQEIYIADGSASSRGVLWEESVGVFSAEQCYQFQNAHISSFNGVKYFSFPKTASYKPISDIGDVVKEQQQQEQVIEEEDIVHVFKVDQYKSCRVCH